MGGFRALRGISAVSYEQDLEATLFGGGVLLVTIQLRPPPMDGHRLASRPVALRGPHIQLSTQLELQYRLQSIL